MTVPEGSVVAVHSLNHWHGRFAAIVRYCVAPLLTLLGGFFTTDFVLSGHYTWPRTSRVMVLTLTLVILSYEFVYKEQQTLEARPSSGRSLRALVYSCVLPYLLGGTTLLLLIKLTR